jgi:hypothetical protein
MEKVIVRSSAETVMSACKNNVMMEMLIMGMDVLLNVLFKVVMRAMDSTRTLLNALKIFNLI